MTVRQWCVGLLGVASLSIAQQGMATTGLEYQWEGTEHQFMIRANVGLTSVMPFQKTTNTNVRISEFRLGVLTTCKVAHTLGKRGWEIHCEIDKAMIAARPLPGDESRTLEVLDDLSAKIEGSVAQIVLGTDGRIKNFDVEGIESSNRRTNLIKDQLRMMLARVFAALELKMPKNGDDKGKGVWKQSNAMAMAMVSSRGSMGSTDLVHTLAAQEGDVIGISTQGHGIMASGETVIINGEERARDTYKMTYSGTASFDVARGVLLRRSYNVYGTATASSFSADGFGGLPYIQEVELSYIQSEADIPVFGENVVLKSTPNEKAAEK